MQITDRDYSRFSHSSRRKVIGKSRLRNWLIKGGLFCGIDTVSKVVAASHAKRMAWTRNRNLSRVPHMYNHHCLHAIKIGHELTKLPRK